MAVTGKLALTEGLRVNVDEKTMEDLELLAAIEDRSIAAIARRAIRLELAKPEIIAELEAARQARS